MIMTQRYYYIFSYATRLLDDCAQTDWATAQAVENRAQVVGFFITSKPYNKTVAEVSCLRSNQRILSDLVLQRPETSATVDYKNYRFTIFFALPSE